MKNELETLTLEFDRLRAQMRLAQQELQQARRNQRETGARHARVLRRARIGSGIGFTALVAAIALASRLPVGAQGGYSPILNNLQYQVNLLIAKTQYQSADPTTKSTKFVGCNVYIQSGSGKTNEQTNSTQLGNLVLGYTELMSNGRDVQNGAHNLILGDANDYNGCGNLIAGVLNTAFASYTSISGGVGNLTYADYASVSGGRLNSASAIESSVSGGANNVASGQNSVVSGGTYNIVTGDYSMVSAGTLNRIDGLYSSTVAGFHNISEGNYTTAAGGENNTLSGQINSLSGGSFNKSDGNLASILGGSYNEAYGIGSVVCGGMICSAGISGDPTQNIGGNFNIVLGGFGVAVTSKYGHKP